MSSSAPCPAVSGWTIYASIFVQRFVFRWYDQTLGSDHTVIGHPNGVVYPCARRNRVKIANGRAFHTTAYLKEVIVAYAHDVLATVDDDDCLLDDAASTDNDGPGECKDGRFRVNDGARANGDIALEVHVLTDHRPGVNHESIASTSMAVDTCKLASNVSEKRKLTLEASRTRHVAVVVNCEWVCRSR